MRSAQLHPGLPVEVDVRGQKFNATVKGVDQGRVWILPFEPQRFTYRTVYIFTLKGREKLAGLDAGGPPSPASVESGENIGAGQTMGKRDQGRSVTSPSAGTDAPDNLGTAGLSVANEEGTAAHGHVGGTLDRPGPPPEGHEIAGASSSGDAESGSKGSAVGAPPKSTAPLPSAEPTARLFGDDPPAAGDPWRNAA